MLVVFWSYLKIFLIAMLPIAELRLAIPVSQALGLDVFPSYATAIAGNMLPVPFIYFFARKILVRGAAKPGNVGRFFRFFLLRGEKAGKKLAEKAGAGLFWALFLFVAIPLPGTGAWTGTLGASILDMDCKRTCAACMLGVLAAGIVMMLGSKAVLHFF